MDNSYRHKLKSLKISGFKSIGKEQKITFGDLTVLIGANGAGKSNLVSFFQLLNHLTTDALQTFIGRQGYADSILYYGTKTTEKFTASLIYENSAYGKNEYEFALVHSYQGQMMFAYETIKCEAKDKVGYGNKCKPKNMGTGHQESKLKSFRDDPTAKTILSILSRCRVYQFHDTAEKSYIRQPSSITDDRYLRSDAGNLSAYLYRLKTNSEGFKYYERIVRRINKIMPQFRDFYLDPLPENPYQVRLEWIDTEKQHIFGAHQISDGSLRFMALATLLLQPPDNLPNMIIIDEPELGLHPEALMDLTGMIKIASENCQIVLATQSPYLLDFIDVDNVVIVDQKNTNTEFTRLDEEKLKEWIETYSMSEMWDKNLIGGRP